MVTFTELENLQSKQSHIIFLEDEKNKFRSHVYFDPQNFSYKFVRCKYENQRRIFNHVEICEFTFQDFPDKADEMINEAINKLTTTNKCWNIEPNKDTYQANVIDCNKCKTQR